MDCIGFAKGDTVIYEGDLHLGYRSHPRPLLTPIAFPDFLPDPDFGPVDGLARTIFREDSFDPVTRIRRGRVFSLYGNQFPRDWLVNDPLRNDLTYAAFANGSSGQKLSAFLYASDPLVPLRQTMQRNPRIIAILGREPFFSVWTALSIEESVMGPPVLTLRLHRSLSGLPEIDYTRFEAVLGERLGEAANALENSNHRQGAIDVVDRCRAVLQLLFAHRTGNFGADLARLVGLVRAEACAPNLACWAADLVNRFHSRGKPNEQHNHDTRTVDEDDAQLAISCVGLVIKEFGLTKAV